MMWALSATKGVRRVKWKRSIRGCGKNRDGVFWNDFYKMTFEKTPEEGEDLCRYLGKRLFQTQITAGERPWKVLCLLCSKSKNAGWLELHVQRKRSIISEVRGCHTLNEMGPLKYKEKTLKCNFSDRKCFQKEDLVYYIENWLISSVERVRPVELVAMALDKGDSGVDGNNRRPSSCIQYIAIAIDIAIDIDRYRYTGL